MVYLVASVSSVVIGFILGALGRFPLFAVAAVVISFLIAGFTLATDRSLGAGVGMWVGAIVMLQLGYFSQLLLGAARTRRDRLQAENHKSDELIPDPDPRRGVTNNGRI